MKDFAAIDFETANNNPSSVCSIGIVIIRDGHFQEKFYSLVRPEPDWYSYRHTMVHGLSAEDTKDADIFPDVWSKIAPKIEGLPLVAHNSRFEEDCLRAVHKAYMMDYPDYIFHCTLRAARRAFAGSIPNLQLHNVAARCGYDLRKHHHALADAEACAMIAYTIM
ncbi:MAG: 3'-5' exonuclease [Tannerellaceae bacterium]|jgi:DNA polymerase-3 subunit epsilon|nr:3'-5' exonuclease [Tannerellaceae bacterium]